MKKIYWRLAEHNAYIGIQCKEYQKRHKFIWGRRWWFLIKCTVRNWFRGNYKGCYITEDEILKKISEYEIISFDIFDTLLIRPYDKPTDLFEELEKRYFMPGFARARVEAEQRAREQFTEREDISYEQIYQVINKKYRNMAQYEVALEQNILQVNKRIKSMYDMALYLKKKIIIISDMYLSHNILECILKSKGYEGFEKLYVSSETGYSKASGNMYEYVLNDLGCKTEKVLHIGDNFWSDGNAYRKSKLSTVLITNESMVQLI